MQFKDLLDKGIVFIPEGPKLSAQDIARWEQIVNSPFPEQYRDYLLHANGGEVWLAPEHEEAVGSYAFYIQWPNNSDGLTSGSLLGEFFMINEIQRREPGFTLTFEYNYNAWKHVLPDDLFPIATDPGGNYILIGLKGERRGKIYYWLFESANAMEEPDVAAYTYLGWVAESFVEFILGLEYVG